MQLKKVLAIVLSVVMIIGVMPFAAFAATVEVANGAALKTAVASASSGDVIEFNADNVAYPIKDGKLDTSRALVIDVNGKDITIDLKGHTQYFLVSGETAISYPTELFVIRNGGKLTVKDSVGGGAIYATYGANSSAYIFNVLDSSKLVIESGKYVMDKANRGGVIVYQNSAAASTVINDGEFQTVPDPTATRNYRNYIVNDTRGDVVINGGTFTTGQALDYVISEGNTTDTKLTINDGEFNGTMSLDVTKADTELNGGTYLTNDGAVNTAVSAYLPADQIIDSTTGEIKDVDASTVARTNSGEFETLAAALASVGADETATITLLADCTLASTTEIADNQKITINLNGNDITCPARVFNIRHGQLTISGTGNLNATFTGANAAVAVYGAATDQGSNYSTFTLSTPAVINAPNGYGAMIGANSGAAYGAKLQLGGTINSKYGVYINGNVAEPEVKTNAAAINITGTVTAGNDNSVVYAAGYAKWNIYSNANLTGGSGVYIKSGTMNIYGNAVITATGAKTDYKFNTNGCDSTGDAIIIDSCGYPGNVPTVTIKAGTITSANGEAVASYAKQDDPLYPTAEFPRVDDVIPATSTAIFSSDVSDLAVAGYKTDYDETAGGYIVKKAENAYSLAIGSNIVVDYHIDLSAYNADGGYATFEYIANPDKEDATRETVSVDLADLPTDAQNRVVVSLKAAPAQIGEEDVISIYNADGELQGTVSASIAQYCEAMKEDATYGELMTALLNYGALAKEYFGYEGASINATEDYKAALSSDEQAYLNANSVAQLSTGVASFAGISYVAKQNPAFKVYFTGTRQLATITGSGLKAKTYEAQQGGVVVNVTGLKASDFAKTFTLGIDGTEMTINGYGYLKSAVKNSDTALANLAKGVFRFAYAAEQLG